MKWNGKKILETLKKTFIESDELVEQAAEEVAAVEDAVIAEEDFAQDVALQEEIAESEIVETEPPKEAICILITEYRGCKEVAAKVVAGYPVFLDYTALSAEDTRRAFDFLSGVLFAHGGKLAQVADSVIYLAENLPELEELQATYAALLAE